MAKFLILVLALSLVLPGSLASAVAYACQMTGEVSPVCCCAGEDGENETVIASQPPCCELRSSENSKSSTPVPANGGELRLRVASVAAVASYLPLGSGTTLSGLTTAAEITPAPPFLVNQTFRC